MKFACPSMMLPLLCYYFKYPVKRVAGLSNLKRVPISLAFDMWETFKKPFGKSGFFYGTNRQSMPEQCLESDRLVLNRTISRILRFYISRFSLVHMVKQ